MVRWIFFDVGSVLFNDDPQSYHAYRQFHAEIQKSHPDYSFEQMLLEREQLSQKGETWVLFLIASRFMSSEAVHATYERLRAECEGMYDDVHLPHDGMGEILDELSRDFRLGIIANQATECRESLRRRQLLDYFSVVGISDELDLHKPDVRLYQWALNVGAEPPEQCVMIGDRKDNDVQPARQAGMKTIWLSWPNASGKNWRPHGLPERDFLASLDRVAMHNVPATSENEPDRIVESLWEVPQAVRSLA